MSGSLPASLPGLTTREAIADAIYRAVTAYDRQDEALLRQTATTDLTFTIGGDKQHGIEEIIEKNFNHVSKMGTTHSLSALRIDYNDSTAKATLNAVAMHVPAGEGFNPGHKSFQVGALYDIDLVKGKDGLWLIKDWILTPVWTSGDGSIMQP